ncbi:hypothetical protein [Metallosphaera hakonensis]|uniref:Uncharacterized protein n=1 Tax=Metallosphaera hakonensis JCM 8857 = DSM 7519 TaxID=1293036 RepID=A0A2U9IRL3_9CREN|nr:hypothetical protein [Metallosphaera hakonensis]AWR98617.1 hypothetical protein DFR87_01640 [Metallosphaera hakonensis JCM 8857 = DSM 7519]
MLKDFEEIECSEAEYYDNLGRFHDMPYYVRAKCYTKEYEWGSATISEWDLDLWDSVTVYLDVVNFPPTIVKRILEDDDLDGIVDKGYDTFMEATVNYSKANIFFYSYSKPVDHNLELECEKEKLVECVDGVSSWINDYIDYLVKVAEDFLRAKKPEELSEVKCEKCGVTLRRYEYTYHQRDHEIQEAKRQFREIQGRIYEIDEREYPLAFKYFRDEIDELIVSKVLPIFKDFADKINLEISKRGITYLNSPQLHIISDIQEEIIRNVPRTVREKFISRMTILPSVLSNGGLTKFINMTVNGQIIQGHPHNFSVDVKRKRERFYVHIYLNGDQIGYLKIDDKIRDKIKRMISQYVDQEDVERITEDLYNKVKEKTELE